MFNTPTRNVASPFSSSNINIFNSPTRLRYSPFRSPRGQHHHQQHHQRPFLFKYLLFGLIITAVVVLTKMKPDFVNVNVNADTNSNTDGIGSNVNVESRRNGDGFELNANANTNVNVNANANVDVQSSHQQSVADASDAAVDKDEDKDEEGGIDVEEDNDDDGNEENYYDDDEDGEDGEDDEDDDGEYNDYDDEDGNGNGNGGNYNYEDDFTDDNQPETSKEQKDRDGEEQSEVGNEEEECTFAQPHSTSPVPLILMSLGRSGSSVTWNTLSTMLGSTTTAYEITGGNRTKAMNFFQSLGLGQNNTTANWAVQRLCQIQKRNLEQYDNPVITGFQWKPYLNTLTHELGRGALEQIANHSQPQIKILYLTRNPLDRLLSNERHRGYVRSDTVPAHCTSGDEECVARHRMHSKGIVLPTGKELVAKIRNAINIDTMAGDLLSTVGVSHITVSYEKLYYSKKGTSRSDAMEWIRIFDFLGRSPKHLKTYKKNLRMRNVERSFAMAPTSPKRHEDSIANFKEVKETLVDAGYGHLLH